MHFVKKLYQRFTAHANIAKHVYPLNFTPFIVVKFSVALCFVLLTNEKWLSILSIENMWISITVGATFAVIIYLSICSYIFNSLLGLYYKSTVRE